MRLLKRKFYFILIFIAFTNFYNFHRVFKRTEFSRFLDKPISLPLDRATVSLSWIMVTVKMAFMAGSSKQGKVFLAYVACICEVAITLKNVQKLNINTK